MKVRKSVIALAVAMSMVVFTPVYAVGDSTQLELLKLNNMFIKGSTEIANIANTDNHLDAATKAALNVTIDEKGKKLFAEIKAEEDRFIITENALVARAAQDVVDAQAEVDRFTIATKTAPTLQATLDEKVKILEKNTAVYNEAVEHRDNAVAQVNAFNIKITNAVKTVGEADPDANTANDDFTILFK